MDSRDYVGPTAVQAAVLPARAVYLVADGSEGGLRRAVQEACTRWGGMTEPIVPVKPGGEIDPWWQRVVSTARADSAMNVDADPDDAAKVAETFGLGSVPLADIDRQGLAAFTVHPDAVGRGKLPGYNAYVMASEKRGLWEVVGAGDLTDEHVESLHGSAFFTRRPHEDEVARAQLSGWTLVERTCSQFAEHWVRGLESGPAVVWVTEPGSFADCLCSGICGRCGPCGMAACRCSCCLLGRSSTGCTLPRSSATSWNGRISSSQTSPSAASPFPTRIFIRQHPS